MCNCRQSATTILAVLALELTTIPILSAQAYNRPHAQEGYLDAVNEAADARPDNLDYLEQVNLEAALGRSKSKAAAIPEQQNPKQQTTDTTASQVAAAESPSALGIRILFEREFAADHPASLILLSELPESTQSAIIDEFAEHQDPDKTRTRIRQAFLTRPKR